MIARIQLRNFKGWADTGSVDLAPITVLFGSNNSGKSSLLQSLLMLQRTIQSAKREIVLDYGGPNEPLNLGHWAEMIHRHDVSRDLDVQLSWDLLENEARRLEAWGATSSNSTRMDYELRVSAGADGKEYVRRLRYTQGDRSFGLERKSESGKYKVLSNPRLTRKKGRAWDLPAPIASHAFPQEVLNYFQNADFTSDFGLLAQWLFGRVFYLGPLRRHPQRTYQYSGGGVVRVGDAGEDAINALLAVINTPGYEKRTEKRNHTLVGQTQRSLRELGVVNELSLERIGESQLWQLRVRTPGATSDVVVTDVGFGISQVLPIVVQAFLAPPGSTVLIEQPELHLHPAVQANLVDLFIAANRSNGVQFVLESHSEHLLRRLQQRIAEEKISEADAAVYFISMSRGTSRIERLKTDTYGVISNWPEHFFGDIDSDYEAMTMARMRRKNGTGTQVGGVVREKR